MNIKYLACTLALLTTVGAALPVAAHAQIYTGTTAKKEKTEDKKPAVKPEDWKTPAPDATGMNFKGRKDVLLAVETDNKGNLTSINIVKSSGDAAVDKRVRDWARQKWSGPKSAKAKIPVSVGQ